MTDTHGELPERRSALRVDLRVLRAEVHEIAARVLELAEAVDNLINGGLSLADDEEATGDSSA